MLFPLFIGMVMSAMVLIVGGVLGFLGFMAKVADQPLQVLEPGEESRSAVYVERIYQWKNTPAMSLKEE
jgi:hypothetical protein